MSISFQRAGKQCGPMLDRSLVNTINFWIVDAKGDRCQTGSVPFSSCKQGQSVYNHGRRGSNKFRGGGGGLSVDLPESPNIIASLR